MSHIVPKFCYKALNDEKNRAFVVDPYKWEVTGHVQSGVSVPMLCVQCEQFLNEKYEKPFYRYWYGGGVIERLVKNRRLYLTGIDYTSFKLFHISILFRASVDSRFVERSLPAHHVEKLRRMVLSFEPGSEACYPIWATAIEDHRGGVSEDVVEFPMATRLYGHWSRRSTYSGCHWNIVTSSHPCDRMSRVCLRENGTMPLLIDDYQSIKKGS